MSKSIESKSAGLTSRRQFLKTSGAAVGALAGTLSIARSAHSAERNTLNVGLVGCGGRGNGAAANALNADPDARLAALADFFPEKVQAGLKGLKERFGDRVTAGPDQCFDGFDAYEKLIASGVDVVILATPPNFRPMHLKAAIEAGKHVFCEKPVAVDAPGVRSVLATCDLARQKGLNVVSGLCWRYHTAVKETMQRVLDGAIGKILSIQENYLTRITWTRPRKEGDTEMAYQMRNWYNFTWLSGDFNVEQHVHSLDKALWAFHDTPPIRAYGLGGRQVRTAREYGDIYDHHAVVYEYPDNVKVHSYCRQQDGCHNDVSDHFMGTKGHADILKFRIDGPNAWEFGSARGINMYDLEHEALFSAIRAGEAINNGKYMAYSTMLAILGRMVDYTGQVITWDEAINSEESLAPAKYSWDADPPTLPDEDGRYRIAMPGKV